MQQKIKQSVERLNQSRKDFLSAIENHDPEIVIYKEGNWRIKDIMVNIGFWELEGARSVEAFGNKKEYFTPGFSEARVEEINKENFLKFKEKPFDEVLAYFQGCRNEMIKQIRKLSDEALEKEMMCPWEKRRAVSYFINEMIVHEQEHLKDIIKQIKS